MSDVPPGRHRARHRAPTAAERVRARLSALPSALPSVPAFGRPALAAVAVTGIVAGGTAGSAALTSSAEQTSGDATSLVASGTESADVEERSTGAAGFSVSRSAPRTDLQQDDVVSLDRQGAEMGVSGAATVEAPSDPRDIALAMLADYGWPSSEFACLDDLWAGESGWSHTATNPTSGAYGIPQSLPAEKMAAAGADWRTNPATQIEWGLGYIEDRYGSPCAANSFKLSNGWY